MKPPTTDKSRITDKNGSLRIDDQLCFALYSTSRAITKQYAPLLEKLNLTYPQYLAMMVLWQKDGQLVQQIADQLELDQATTTPLIQRMEKLGLLTRQRSNQDERKVEVYLTDKGRDLYKKALDVPQQIGCAIGVDDETARRLIEETGEIKSFITQNS